MCVVARAGKINKDLLKTALEAGCLREAEVAHSLLLVSREHRRRRRVETRSEARTPRTLLCAMFTKKRRKPDRGQEVLRLCFMMPASDHGPELRSHSTMYVVELC